jgi:hypothetical protein
MPRRKRLSLKPRKPSPDTVDGEIASLLAAPPLSPFGLSGLTPHTKGNDDANG